jgi:hypothetical protein
MSTFKIKETSIYSNIPAVSTKTAKNNKSRAAPEARAA